MKRVIKKTVLLMAAIAVILSGLVTEAFAATGQSKPATAFTIGENAKFKVSPLDYTDTRDAEWVKRGFIARVAKDDPEPLLITNGEGTIVWDMSRYDYISGDISKPATFPDTVNPSLWRQAILNVNYGLYEVASRDLGGGEVGSIYQVRGYDLANMSFVETKNGFIVVDVTSYKESALAAVKLLYDHLPSEKKGKKIHTVIYTHSHIDHFGGIDGVLASGMAEADVEIVAPDGFFEAATSENVTVGPAMTKRARWMYGIPLAKLDIPEGRGQVNNGLAIGSGAGTSAVPTAPTTLVTQDGTHSFDGTAVEFLLAPNTEAPAEMTMLFPEYRSICLAEICNQAQHNLLTPRGAQVRDSIAWSEALEKMKQKWVDTGRADSAWGPHHWPRWGSEAVGEYIEKQSRLYRHLHDRTVELMNEGRDMKETAEAFTFPADLENEWFNRGYYGATVHNVKAVYQKYLGWFDNNPAKLWALPDKISAELYAKYLPQGGNLLDAARLAYAEGQYRWVVEVLDHVRLAPNAWDTSVYDAALDLQADAFEQMAYATESGIWRNYFLTGAWRNRSKELQDLLEVSGTANEPFAAYRASGQRIAASSQSKQPTEFTIRENARVKEMLPFATDTRDAEWVKRGFIARVASSDSEPLLITNGDGGIVWNMSRYDFISGDISKPDTFPDTVNPSLWRQAILNANYGLYEVASRDLGDGEVGSIYQVRGYDLANMSFVETKNGFIVVDVTSYKESAEAAVKLLYDHLPAEKKGKRIHTVIYTHSHIDHYGGIDGVIKSGYTADSVEIVAPDGFFEAATSENVTVGPAMTKRARWMYGLLLWRIDIPEGRGQVNNGLAVGSGAGTSAVPTAPTKLITQDGTHSFDETTVEFLLAPNTEAPAEMTMLFTEYRSICLAEICNQAQHNLLTPRGAQVRDSIAWSEALSKMKQKWVDTGRADSAWGPHHWPRWGSEAVGEYIEKQSRLYRHLHDRTVELMNEGRDMKETAEAFAFPADLANEWFNRGYYGATVHNVKAVYQKYLGWFDNNPAKLWELPDSASAELYAKYLSRGGSLLDAARAAYADGEYRWVVEVLDHIRLAPNAWDASTYATGTELQADAFEQMAYAAESGIWRNYFVTGAWRNRDEEFRKLLEGDEGNGGGSVNSSSGCDAGLGALWIALLALVYSRNDGRLFKVSKGSRANCKLN